MPTTYLNISSFFLFAVAVIIISSFAGLSSSSSSNSFNNNNNNNNNVDKSRKLLVSDGVHDDLQPSAHSITDDLFNLRFFINSLYQFGDSLSDVGNYKWENPYSSFAQPPYGMTYFHKPTGRPSNGRLMVDYIAEYFCLPFTKPYLNTSENFKHGANFAVIGATALDVSTLIAKNVVPTVTNHSLSVQVNWFKSHLASICSHPLECRTIMSRAAFVVGEIGGNDYNFAISTGKPPNFWYQMVPEVVQAISNAAEELICLGAGLILIPGNILTGCMPVYLAGSNPNDPNLYDELKCIKVLNDLSKFHNNQLRIAIRNLRSKHPQTIILYMDLEGTMTKILQNPTIHGFDEGTLLKTCCGSGNDDYNFNYSSICGTPGVSACEHPENRVIWDGWHLTSHVYEIMVRQHLY